MGWFSLEHSKAAYRADFALSGLAVLLMLALLLFAEAATSPWVSAAWAGFGLAAWTLIEYLLHRHVLHGLQPFHGWHLLHHQRPNALIYTPTVLTAALIATLVFLPAFLIGNVGLASALTLGVLAGNLIYAITHHATHHCRARSGWSRARKQAHALHHHHVHRPYLFGVTSSFWDHVFCSATPRRSPVEHT